MLGLALHLLEIDQLGYTRTGVDVMAPGHADEPEPKRLDEGLHVAERDVGQVAAGEAL